MNLRRSRLAAVLVVLGMLVATPSAAGTEEAASAPRALIEKATGELVTAVRAHRDQIDKNMQVAYDIAAETVLPYVDFPRIARWVLGKHWRTATPEQRETFTREFRDFLTHTYVTMMVEYSDQILARSDSVSYPTVRQSSDGTRSLVRSLIKLDSGSDVEVDYRMYLADAGWRVYDVVVGGVSLAATYRASFGEQIDRGGFDGLIAYLVAQSQ